MDIQTQSFSTLSESYKKTLAWMSDIGVNISPGRTRYYERIISHWATHYLTASAKEGKNAFPEFVSSMLEISDFIDIYKSLSRLPLSKLMPIADKLQKGVNGPINSVDETSKSSGARNFIFEALVAARCHEPNNDIQTILNAKSDTGIRVGKTKIWVECKRITSINKLEANVRDATRQLERILKHQAGSRHRGIVAIDFSKILHKGDKLLIKTDDDNLRNFIKYIMEFFIEQHSNQWEKVYTSKDRRICGTILRFSTMATIENCSGQLIPDSDLSFSSLATGGNPSFAACGRF